jgi:putative OPT family oligopeptide transporter
MAQDTNGFVPYVPANQTIPELTIKAVVLGVLLGVVMTAANTYLGLYAGMTVSASIPAAVISMGILRGILRRGTILENNIVQTIGSAGESLAAGIIFTIPALVITGVWTEFKFWPVTLVAILGGMLGVLFMIPLRRALIVEEVELRYPEGLACAEVLEVGDKGGSGVIYVFVAMAVGAIFKFLVTGVGLIKGAVEGGVRVGKSALYFGSDISVALVAVGYIVGFNVALLIFLGGSIGWLFGIPIFYLFTGFPEGGHSVVETMGGTWNSQIRFMGVGAMVAGGVWSIIGVRRGIVKGIQGAIAGYKAIKGGEEAERTQKDINIVAIAGMLAPTALLIFGLYYYLTGSVGIAGISGVAMIIMAFFFVAVSSYIVGLVGSSNNPVSGMTICTVLFTSALLLIFGMRGDSGIIAALGVAGVVCCAACTAGDVSQDLKTGYLVGATPWRQQWAQVIGVIAPAFVIAPILTVLHSSYGIGVQVKEGVEFLKAPQAGLFASITQAMFNPDAHLPWTMVIVGLVIGISIIILDEFLKKSGSQFRTYVMPVAVGIYLPWALSVPIMIGGLAALLTGKIVGAKKAKESVHRGVLVGSGLIAGEALMGIIIAFLIFLQIAPPKFSMGAGIQSVISVLALFAVIGWMMYVAIKGKTEKA